MGLTLANARVRQPPFMPPPGEGGPRSWIHREYNEHEAPHGTDASQLGTRHPPQAKTKPDGRRTESTTDSTSLSRPTWPPNSASGSAIGLTRPERARMARPETRRTSRLLRLWRRSRTPPISFIFYAQSHRPRCLQRQ